jgi:nitrate/nitrite-specific signal transduction histidine kinase
MKKTWWGSLQVKIVAWSFIPTLIILSAVAWFTFYSYQRVLGDLAVEQDWAVVHAKADQAHEPFAGLLNARLRPILFDVDTDPSLPIEVRSQNILERAPGLEIFDGGIYFVDRDGRIFETLPEHPELIGQDWSDSPQFRFVRDNPPGSAPLTDLRVMGPDGAGIVCVLWPMHDAEGQFRGAGYYCLSIDSTGQSVLYELFNGLSLGPSIRILDGNQRVLYSADPTEAGRDLSAEASVQQLLQGESLSIRFRRGTEDMLISYDPLAIVLDDRDRWVVISEQSWSEVMRPSLPYRQLLLVLLALGVAVPTLVTAYGVRHITGPIQKLIQASKHVTAGQFGHRIEVETGDEIETLADQFNLMSAALADSVASLEEKVSRRTDELATLNAIAAGVSSSLNLNEIMADALERIMELTGMEHGVAYRIAGGEAGSANTGTDAEEPHLRVMAFRGLPPTYADLGDGLPLRQSAAGVAGRRGEPVIWTLAELPTENALRERLVTLGVEQVIAIPLLAKGRLVGSLNLSTNQSRTYPPEQMALLKAIGQQIGVAVENARLYEQAGQSAILAERGRLARELHDAVTQTLFSANLIADVIPSLWERDPEEGMRSLEELRQLTRGALAEMRTMLLEMRPKSLERSDIKSLLTQLADAFLGRVRVPVELVIQGDCRPPQEVKVVFYRVAQEALNNIAKHSGARKVSAQLECGPDRLNLCIKDDGLGFEPGSITPDHMGMAIMRERASSIGARLTIDTQPGQGTMVKLDWGPARKEGLDEHSSANQGDAGR